MAPAQKVPSLPLPIQDTALHRMLFAPGSAQVYAILDGASVPHLPQALWEHAPEHVCLYRGDLAPDLAATAPYLVRLEAGGPFTDRVLREGWGRHWGIFALGGPDLLTLRKHFRGFLQVRGPDGRQLYFRYYDPRVLRVWLETCTPPELEAAFGPVAGYVAEAEDPATALRFTRLNGKSRKEAISLQPQGG